MASETDDARLEPACPPSGSVPVPQHRSWADVSLANLQHNVRLAQSLVGHGVAVAAVVKADAYGHGAVPVARAAVDAGAAALVVANADEGVELRQAGIAAPIIIIGASFAWEAEAIVAHDLAACVSPPSMLDVLAAEACRQQRRVRVHV
ncbi:alanine racemase, partial [bacterium]|nr:alanine racemase [bacterium]